jgi:hypothetical protein
VFNRWTHTHTHKVKPTLKNCSGLRGQNDLVLKYSHVIHMVARDSALQYKNVIMLEFFTDIIHFHIRIKHSLPFVRFVPNTTVTK